MTEGRRPIWRLALVACVALVAIACGPAPSTIPQPTPGPSPTPGPALTLPELKYALVDRFGPLWYCDPDFYPIAREDEQKLALERFPEIEADTEASVAILRQLGLDILSRELRADEKLAVYREWKALRKIALEPIGNDRYRFDHLAQPPAGAAEGARTAGFIDLTGDIEIERQEPAGEPMCPICLARGTRIDTPDGPVAVQRLQVGDPVLTLDASGNRIRGTVVAIGSTPAPASHEVVRLVLEDGRSVTASPGHPLADGRVFSALLPGAAVDGSTVVSVGRLPYTGGETFDVRVSGPSGAYIVDGIALGSTLDPSPR